MRILFITAFYPPFEIGGWEQLTQELVDRLRDRGHDVRVLTSNFRMDEKPDEISHVSRVLRLENNLYYYNPMHFFSYRKGDLRYNVHQLGEMVQSFKPHVIMIHSMWNLSQSIPWKVEQLMPGQIVYYLADYWPIEQDVNESFWQSQAIRGGAFGWRKHVADIAFHHLTYEKKRYCLAFDHTIFVSQAVQKHYINSGLKWAENSCVIHNGVDIYQFRPALEDIKPKDGFLLFVGSLSPHKGLHTVLDALALLAEDQDISKLILRVAGSGHEEHIRGIKIQIENLGLTERVNLLGRIDRTKMPELYRQAYALVFPSIWEEPLARATQEAMASGLPIITTLTGGTSELVRDGINGLTYQPGDVNGLADNIKRLWMNPTLARQLGKAARKTIEDGFNIDLTTSKIENYLCQFYNY